MHLLHALIALIALSAMLSGRGGVASDEQKELVASSFLPLEFQFLIESYQKYRLTKGEREELFLWVREIDKNLSYMPKRYLFLLVKVEIYKEILDWKVSPPPVAQLETTVADDKVVEIVPAKKRRPSRASIKILTEKLSENYQGYNSFAKWMVESIQADLWDVGDIDAYFDEQKKLSASEKIVREKVNLLYPWYQSIISLTAEEFNNELKPLMRSLLARIAFYSRLMVHYSSFQYKRVASKVSSVSEYDNFDLVVRSENSSSDAMEKTEEGLDKYQKMKRDEANKIIEDLNIPESSQEHPLEQWQPKD
ncbi:MAG: hypothetical protein HQK52_11130 [Oligoflexia bacterium]|nr:hypothetical protein [Oligoflexia bacterium]